MAEQYFARLVLEAKKRGRFTCVDAAGLDWANDEIGKLRAQVSALQTERDEATRRCAITETVLKNGAEGLWELADYRADNLSLNEGLRESAAARRKLEAELAEEKRLHKHWRDQHANEVRRAKILKDTTDLPLERVRAYELMGELQGQVERLKGELELSEFAAEFNAVEAQKLSTSYEKGAESMRKRAVSALREYREIHGVECRCESCMTVEEVMGDIRTLPLKETP